MINLLGKQLSCGNALLLSALFLYAALVQASEDGEIDDTSQGIVQVSLSILPSIQLENVDDIRLNITNRRIDNHFEQTFCVTGNRHAKYTVTASGSADNQYQFLLYNNQMDSLPYSVNFREDANSTAWDSLYPDQPSRGYNVTPFSSDCENAALFRITFSSTDLTRVKSGLYTGHLTLTVSPI